ncbi:FAD-dependent oxidoreductase [Desertimonas flava]|uniref:FAD-dependent oxidoreductase n=1 Tax=Desertimonas flava TaxID=2064846 RepID=UPI000E340D8F|nr:FAD-dependent oxidoreductase [Desertimonas flava]
MNPTSLPVAVIGAGPVGLAAAAHLHERGIPFVVFEVGDDVATSIREWAHVQLFSPWSYNIDPAARRLLEADGWSAPDDDEHPSGGELIEHYLVPLALLPAIGGALRTNRLVTGITRVGTDKVTNSERSETPFSVTTEGPFGPERTLARAVIDATGTWLTPNPVGADGRPAIGERHAGDLIEAGIPDVLGRDRRRYAKRRVAVVGSGHSAQNAVRDLAALADRALGTEVTWIVRRSDPGQMFGGKANDQLPERGRLGADAQHVVDNGVVQLVTGFRTDRITHGPDGATLVAVDGREAGPFDRIVNATGFRPDLEMLSELRVDVDPVLQSARALAPMIDPNVHSCGSVPPHGAAELAHPEPGLFIVGAKSYGRAPTFLLATGYEQVRSVVAELAGDRAAADDVQLILPETGVCSLDRTPPGATTVERSLITVPDAAGACCN